MKTNFENVNIIHCLLIVVFVSILTGCFESEAEQIQEDGDKVTAARAGQIYYDENCSTCHSANIDDTSSAFQATDLALRQSPLSHDLSRYGGPFQLMNQFSNVPQSDIDNLEAYLATF